MLVHGGMAQDVGPILEMVTEKYLLRAEAEWQGRQAAIRTYDAITGLLRQGDIRAIGAATERNFRGPIQTIIPWASNLYTETLIDAPALSLALISGASGCWAAWRAAAWALSSTRGARSRRRIGW